MKLKHLKSVLTMCAIFLLGALSTEAYAQVGTGVVVDAQKEPIIGVTVHIKNTTTYASTDLDGAFTFENLNFADILVFQMIGLQTLELTVGDQRKFDVTMYDDVESLQGTVITALGIRREKKALGYAIQEVSGSEILRSRESNVANALSGKVSGLQVIRSSGGPGASSKIVLRGNNSLTGSNQPLIVVDGVPLDNFTGAENNDYWNPGADFGNGLSDINPEDIESMSVLKGASAAALYGSRAGNGVIMITTKTGKKQEGLGLTVSATVGLETVFMKPEYQNSFGQGSNGAFDEESKWSWGPKIEGQMVMKHDGEGGSEQIAMAAYDNLDNYFDKPGLSITENVTFQQAYEKVSVYTSFTRSDEMSIIPGAKLGRTALSTRAVSRFGKNNKWTLDTKIQYTRQHAENRPIGGTRLSNDFMNMYLMPRSMDIRWFEKATTSTGDMLWYVPTAEAANPYWSRKYNLTTDTRDRFIMAGSLKYDFTDWLKAEVKVGTDMYSMDDDTKKHAGSPSDPTGRYSAGKKNFNETNYSGLVTVGKDDLFNTKFGATFQIGGNLMSTYTSKLWASSGALLVPDLFTINNAENGKPTIGEEFEEKKINSIYGILSLNWDGWLFLDGTFRNDWSSTLSKANRSFFYPSISASWVVTDMLEKIGGNLPNWLSFAKVRASFAQVGNDLSPYQLYNTYSMSTDPTGAPTAQTGRTDYNENVKNELITSVEVGAELRVLEGRLGLDVAWYKSNATNQLIDLPIDPSSGYNNMKINAGNIQNTGWEFMLDARLFDTMDPKGFTWDLMFNYSFNRNTIEELYEGVTQYGLATYDDLQILAKEGELYGDIYGSTYKRVEEGQYAGQLLLDGNGLPQRDGTKTFLGNQQAHSLLGLTSSFKFHNVDLSFLIDARFGGMMFSGTNQRMQLMGTGDVTVDANGERPVMILDGVVADGDGYVANTKEITTQKYWETVAGSSNVGIAEANMYDATNIRLRNIQIGYTLPRSLFKNAPIQSIRFGLSCNNVWMIYSTMNGIDPESVFSTGSNAVGYESFSSPTTRSFQFNVTFNF